MSTTPNLSAAVSLPQPADDAALWVGIAGFLLWAWFVCPVQVQRFWRAPLLRLPLPRTYQPGWPPPESLPERGTALPNGTPSAYCRYSVSGPWPRRWARS